MNTKQRKAVHKTLIVAKNIQKTNPEVAKLYQQGSTNAQIADYLKENGYDQPYLQGSVHYAIKGHTGGFDVRPFSGLITDQELLDSLGHKHRVQHGKRLYQEGRGVHGIPKEIRREYSQKAGRTASEKSKRGEIRMGSAALPLEERIRISRRGIHGRGQIP